MNINITRHSVTIRELPSGWLNKQTGQQYKAAANALKAVNRDAKAITKSNPDSVVITTITWEPTTRIGTMVVKAITNK